MPAWGLHCLAQVGYGKQLRSGILLVSAVIVVPAALSDFVLNVCKEDSCDHFADSPISETLLLFVKFVH